MPVHDILTILQNGARARLRSVPLPYTSSSLGLTSILLQHGFIHRATRGTLASPADPRAFAAAASSPASRRLWVDLKYSTDDRPVLGHARSVSKPSRRIWLDARELLRLVTGRRAQFVSPLQLGEIAIVRHTGAARAGRTAAKGEEAETAGTAGTPPVEEKRGIEEWIEAREAVGRGIGGEVVARIG